MSEKSLNVFYQSVTQMLRQDLTKQKKLLPQQEIMELCASCTRKHRDLKSLLSVPAEHSPAIIGGVQKAFPHAGVVVEEFDYLQTAQLFEKNKCAAVAVVTEKHFYAGSASMLSGITHLVALPVIRWDFIVDAYQIWQSRIWGADAVRIVVALLDQLELEQIIQCADEQGIEVIAEITDLRDYERIANYTNKISAVYICTADSDSNSTVQMLDAIKSFPRIIDTQGGKMIWDLPCEAVALFAAEYYSPARLQDFMTFIHAKNNIAD